MQQAQRRISSILFSFILSFLLYRWSVEGRFSLGQMDGLSDGHAIIIECFSDTIYPFLIL